MEFGLIFVSLVFIKRELTMRTQRMDTVYIEFPDFREQVRAIRERQGLSRRQVAEKAGCSTSTVEKIEMQKSGASMYMFEKICYALNVYPILLDSNIFKIR
jgi:ribosome-binding protein aMBF1 (putative translation factor)